MTGGIRGKFLITHTDWIKVAAREEKGRIDQDPLHAMQEDHFTVDLFPVPLSEIVPVRPVRVVRASQDANVVERVVKHVLEAQRQNVVQILLFQGRNHFRLLFRILPTGSVPFKGQTDHLEGR